MLVLDVPVGSKFGFVVAAVFDDTYLDTYREKIYPSEKLFSFNQVTKSQINLCVDNFAEMQRGKFVHNFRIVSLLYQDHKNKDDIRAAQLAQSEPNCPLVKQPLALLINTSKASHFVFESQFFRDTSRCN